MLMRLWKQAMCTAAAMMCLAGAANGQVVISQVYGGGGNTGATYTHDFIELFNRGNVAVDLTGWSVQYTSSSGTNWQKTDLVGLMLMPGQYYLIQQAMGSGGSTPLPTPDAAGTISMSASNGKVALVNNTMLLVGSCPTAGVVDFVGFGSANCFEGGGATPALTNTTAAIRAGDGCVDTDNNNADFSALAPNPRNTSSPLAPCGGSTPPTGLGASTPGSQCPGFDVLITVAVSPGSPAAAITGVTADLTAIGGLAGVPMLDDGTGGDVTPGDGVYSLTATIAPLTTVGSKNIPIQITDALARTGNSSAGVLVLNCNPRATTGTGASPTGVCNGENVLLTVNVTPGIQPDSTGITVRADLSAFGLGFDELFTDNGNNNHTYLLTVPINQFPNSNTVVFTVADLEGRSTLGQILFTNVNCTQSAAPVVISQVFGGGGNQNAPLQRDYVELFNRTGAPIDLTGWSVQYGSATGAGGFSSKTDLVGTIPAFGYFLVAQSTGNSCDDGGMPPMNIPCGDPLPVTPDVSGTIAMSATAGRVALVSDTVLVGTNCAAMTIVDLVGYGNAICSEGAGTAGTLSNTVANYRRDGGCWDTDNNIVDFFTASPIPRNSGSPINNCTGAATGACCATDGSCSVTTSAACTGAYQGDGTGCTPNPCPQPTGACCAGDGSCSVTTSAACTGAYQGDGTGCTPNPCPQPTGACCLNGGGCSVTTGANCALANGDYQGDGSSCTPDP
ncbi:MAG: lamin tail domain-containing protein, partial [Phycisphaerales bacterium]